MQRTDRVRIQHMLDAARTAKMLTRNRTRAELDKDIALQLALVKLVEIIGEAATKVSPHLQEQHPEIPWQKVTGTRHRLIHAYYDINRDILWSTVAEDLPPLAANLARMLDQDR